MDTWKPDRATEGEGGGRAGGVQAACAPRRAQPVFTAVLSVVSPSSRHCPPKNPQEQLYRRIIYSCFLSDRYRGHRSHTCILVRNGVRIMLFSTAALLAICSRRCRHSR